MLNAICRNCRSPLTMTLVDLGNQPLSNSYVPMDKADAPEPMYPLHARVCTNCWLVQVDDVVPEDSIFDENYAYFSSFSTGWLKHCKAYADKMIDKLDLGPESLVAEIASNDGYLLQYFHQAGVKVLGIEPTKNTANVAALKGVPSVVDFWSEKTACWLTDQGIRPDLIASANVLAHVPDINDFIAGLAHILQGEAVYTVEFPHLLNMLNQAQFDTIYHEHYSYLSLLVVESIMARHGMRVFDVEEVPTHGGSLRVFACLEGASHQEQEGARKVRADEAAANLDAQEGYAGYAARCEAVRDGLMDFLKTARSEGKSVAAYGAAAKGNTLLNYAGIGTDLIAYCVDKNPAKQNTLLPGSKIPVHDPEMLRTNRPDYLVILPWNIRDEVIAQETELAALGTKFVTAVPEIRIT